jgi:predicted nucleotidyltransferase
MSIQHILDILQDKKVKQYLHNHAIRHLSVGGSFAKGNAREDSDIDLIVTVDPSMVGTDYFSLPRYLQEKLGRPIDLIDADYINKHIKESLLSHTVKVW